jgi:hypothetical protein
MALGTKVNSSALVRLAVAAFIPTGNKPGSK